MSVTDTLLQVQTALKQALDWWLEGLRLLVPAKLRSRIWETPNRLRVRAERDGLHFVWLYSETGAKSEGPFMRHGDVRARAQAQAWMSEYPVGDAEVEVALPRELVLIKALRLPLAAERDLRDILALDMDRHTPFNAEQIYFDCQITARDARAGSLECMQAVVRRDDLDAILDELHELDLVPARVSVQESGSADFDLLPASRRLVSTRDDLRQTRLWAGVAFAAFLIMLYGPPLRFEGILDSWKTRVDRVRTQATEAHDVIAKRDTLLARSRFVEDARVNRIPMIDLLDSLSSTLSDDTWLSNLSVRDKEVQLTGESSSATALIPLLEHSPLLEKVEFRSPVTHNAATGKDRFQISAVLTRKGAS